MANNMTQLYAKNGSNTMTINIFSKNSTKILFIRLACFAGKFHYEQVPILAEHFYAIDTP